MLMAMGGSVNVDSNAAAASLCLHRVIKVFKVIVIVLCIFIFGDKSSWLGVECEVIRRMRSEEKYRMTRSEAAVALRLR